MKQLKKEVRRAFGNTIFLVGVDKETNKKRWLQAPSWDCGWYWGFGYVKEYTHANPEVAKDVSTHTHWDCYITGKREYYDFDAKTRKLSDYSHHPNDENSPLKASVLSDAESWKLAELMKTAYNLKQSAEVFGRGGSYVSNDEKEVEIVKRETWAREINEVILPAIFQEIERILSPEVV